MKCGTLLLVLSVCLGYAATPLHECGLAAFIHSVSGGWCLSVLNMCLK